MMIAASPCALEARLQRVLEVHFDPEGGSRFWIERARAMGVDPRRTVRRVEDLACLGETTQAHLRSRPLLHFIPRRFHDQLDRFIIGQTGGTTGPGAWTAYREDEFRAAFVDPFVHVASTIDFPRAVPWLFIGPSGPHIIGKAMRELARAMFAPDPFSVDFDPRWARAIEPGSVAQRRYLDHVIDQAMDVITTQGVGVLFTTPTVLMALAARLPVEVRGDIQGVHYGGVALDPHVLRRFQEDLFPNAVHLSGYGNTLFGCCLELTTATGRPLDYFPHGDRLVLEVVDSHGVSARTGRVRFTRLDESHLIVRMVERDVAEALPPPALSPDPYHLSGVRNPRPERTTAAAPLPGLY